jgi:hypothetical protein
MKLPREECRKRPLRPEIGTEQDAAWLDSPDAQKVLKESRRHAQHGNRVTHKRQGRGKTRERLRVFRHCQVTCISP